jgi:hypothetical protein
MVRVVLPPLGPSVGVTKLGTPTHLPWVSAQISLGHSGSTALREKDWVEALEQCAGTKVLQKRCTGSNGD